MNIRTQNYTNSFNEAFPLGNGRLGAMVYGDGVTCTFTLNENTLWSGMPHVSTQEDSLLLPHRFLKDGLYGYEGSINKNGKFYQDKLQELKKMIINKEYTKATHFAEEWLQGGFSQSYMPFGKLILSFDIQKTHITNYYKSLDLKHALYTEELYTQDNTIHVQSFMSYPQDALFIYIKSIKHIDLCITLKGGLIQSSFFDDTAKSLVAYGKCPSYASPYFPESSVIFEENKGIGFIGGLKVLECDGIVLGNYLKSSIKEACEIFLAFDIQSGFKAYNLKPQSDSLSLYPLLHSKLEKLDNEYSYYKEEHIDDYQCIANSSLKISTNESFEEDIDYEKTTCCATLCSLLFEYGLYLLIASSRGENQPCNLQGLWNDSTLPVWSCNYTTNINLEMNYWGACVFGIEECILPLFKCLEELSIAGKKTAKDYYNARGFVCHHNTDLWRHTQPTGNGVQHTLWAFGGAWLSLTLYQFLQYNPNEKLLKRLEPLLEESSLFYVDFLTQIDGIYHTIPSTSPENNFIDPKTKQRAAVAMSSSMDISLLNELFNATLDTLAYFNKTDSQHFKEIKEALKNLASIQKDNDGGIAEWYHKDLFTHDNNHRHISHLYGLYPYNLFFKNEELLQAATKSLLQRGELGTGWSLVWKIACHARLKNTQIVQKLLQKLYQKAAPTPNSFNHILDCEKIDFVNGGGLYPNFLLAHPPFQIDSSLGIAAALVEIFVQCHNDYIELLPCLPSTWSNGMLCNIKLKGGIRISIKWKESALAWLELCAFKDSNVKIKYQDCILQTELKANTPCTYTQSHFKGYL